MMKINKIILSVLIISLLGNVFLFKHFQDIRKSFYHNIKENITAHIVSGRLDHVEEQFKTLKNHNFPLIIDFEWIYQAVLYAHSDILEYLFANNVSFKLDHDSLPLIAVFRNNDAKTISILIKHGLKFSAEDLSNAAYWGSFEIVQMILNTNKFSQKDYTDALFASLSLFPNKKILEVLIKNGANLHSKNQNPIEKEDLGKTPIDMVNERIKKSDRKEQWKDIKKMLNHNNIS